MFKNILILLFAVTIASAVRVNVRPCVRHAGGPHRVPDWFEAEDCTPDARCTISRSRAFTARAAFTPHEVFNTLTLGVNAQWLGVSFPMPVPPGFENVCTQLEEGRTCPVTAFPATPYIWDINMPLDASVPMVNNVDLEGKNSQTVLEEFFNVILFPQSLPVTEEESRLALQSLLALFLNKKCNKILKTTATS